MMARTYTRLQNLRLWFAFILILGVSFAALAEGLVRLRAWIKYGSSDSIEDILHIDPEIGLRVPIANSSIFLARRSKITINSLGFRSPELESPKPAGTIRLAFLGGSTTFSSEVTTTEKNWPHLVTETLRRQFPGTKFDYLNASVPGHRIESSLKNLESRVKPLLPDIIIIYHANNDLAVDVRELALGQGLVESDAKPIFNSERRESRDFGR